MIERPDAGLPPASAVGDRLPSQAAVETPIGRASPPANQPGLHEFVVCVNQRYRADNPSCAGRGSAALVDAIEQGIALRRIAARVVRIRCFGHCTRGPAMRLVPGGEFYFEVGPTDVPRILADLEAVCGRQSPDGGVPSPPIPPPL